MYTVVIHYKLIHRETTQLHFIHQEIIYRHNHTTGITKLTCDEQDSKHPIAPKSTPHSKRGFDPSASMASFLAHE